jgi:hypothetical protein
MKVLVGFVAVLVATLLVLVTAVALGPVALAAAGIAAVALLVLAGFLIAESVLKVRGFGPFPEPTGSPRVRHQTVAHR